MNMPPISPITKRNNTRPITKIKVTDIITLYKKQCDIDVSRFFKNLEEIEIYECQDTSFRFYHPSHTAGDGSFYEELQKIYESKGSVYYRPWFYDHQFAWEHIKAGDKVLEVGCGVGMFLEKLKNDNIEAAGLEFSAFAVKKCQEKGLAVENESLETHALNHLDTYDVVCSFQVLEHVTDIHSFFTDALKCLKKGGKLILGVPNNEPYFQRFNKYDTLNLPPHHSGLWNLRAFLNSQSIFSIKLENYIYAEQLTFKNYIYTKQKGYIVLLNDAYLRAKLWSNIKTLIHHHTIIENITLAFLMIFTTPLSMWKYFTSGINSGAIAVQYRK
jgi:2-polyprenyl-3-methyl-5-hydroxy-6-metoxy-1,4-benzoquinol methylase